MLSAKAISILFRGVFIFLTISNYIVFVCITWMPILLQQNYLVLILLIIFHFLFGMSAWTTLVTYFSDPGQVPLYWGFYIGDPDSMRSRYCLMCNVFKPVRCHHCSVCNRCVLNMDHHCPWINNCIGFYNRKYFIQMVFYLNCTLIFVLVCNGGIVVKSVLFYIREFQWSDNDMIWTWRFMKDLMFLIVYVLDCIMEVILIQFLKFHIKLVLENKTTIETLDHKGKEFLSKYDKGKIENYYEVMGTSKCLWFFPLKRYYGKPKGNGIDWGELIEENQMEMNENYNKEQKDIASVNNDQTQRTKEIDNSPISNNNNNNNPISNKRNAQNDQSAIHNNKDKDNSQISMISKHHKGHSSIGSLYDNPNN